MITAYMLLNARQGKLKLVSNAVRTLAEVVEVHEIYGRYDVLAKVEVESYDGLRTFSQNKMQIVEGLRNCETLLVRDTGEDEAEEELEDEP